MINLFCIRPRGFNVGNDAIYLGLQHFLYRSFGEVVNVINLPATSKYESHSKAGLTAKTIYEINQYGHGVIIGGGNLYENGELEVNLDALSAVEVPMMIFSVSRGRVYNRRFDLVRCTDTMPDRLIKAMHQKADIALYRDQATVDHARHIGCDDAIVGGCPTIFLNNMKHRLPEVPGNLEQIALISIRTPELMSIPLTEQARVRTDILEMVKLLRLRGHDDVRLLCHDCRDIAFAASFTDLDYVYTDDVMIYLSMLSRCAINVSYRLHSFLPCVSFGRPAVKISYDERAISLVDTLGLGDWNINMIRESNLIDAIANRLDNMSQLTRIREDVQPAWDNIYHQFDSSFADFAEKVNRYLSSVNNCETRQPLDVPPLRLVA